LHEPILQIQAYKISHPEKFGRTWKKIAKNTKNCAIDSFFLTEYDPAKNGTFHGVLDLKKISQKMAMIKH
jgi:hypothetical protein